MKRLATYLLLALAIVAFSCKKEENTSTATETAATTSTTATGTTETTTTTKTTTTTPTGTATVNDHDKDFITGAAKAGKAEVELGQDALKHATNAEVKSFAQKIIDCHTKAGDELAKIAASKGVTLPTEARAGFKEAKERLMKLTGASFDQAFTQQMTDDHESAIKDFDDAAHNATDADVKAFAAKTLPVLRDHLKMAQDLHAKLNGPKKK